MLLVHLSSISSAQEMNITIRDLVNKGYLVVGQQLREVYGSKKINLYVDSAVVSCEYHGNIIQCDTFDELGKTLKMLRPILMTIKTMDDVTMHTIQQKYVDDFQDKFNITDIITFAGTSLEIHKDHYHDLDNLKKRITEYHPGLKNFDFLCSSFGYYYKC